MYVYCFKNTFFKYALAVPPTPSTPLKLNENEKAKKKCNAFFLEIAWTILNLNLNFLFKVQ
jgi:hypothetical protein